jgi:hypothetical protein
MINDGLVETILDLGVKHTKDYVFGSGGELPPERYVHLLSIGSLQQIGYVATAETPLRDFREWFFHPEPPI